MENMQYAEELVREFLVFRGFTNTLQAFEMELSTDIGRKDEIAEFFRMYGTDLLQRGQDWTPWFVIPYLKNPSVDPQFRLYFSREWFDALHLSIRNFLSEIFNGTRIPALLKISSEKNTINRLKKDIKQLNLKLSQLQALLEEKEAQICRSRSYIPSAVERSLGGSGSSYSANGAPLSGAHEESILPSRDYDETCAPSTSHLGETELPQDLDVTGSAKSSELTSSKSDHENGREMQGEEEFPEVKVDFQETFLGHTSPISRCRFSASGRNIASASVDGTVRIWTYDSSTPTSRNATIYCGAEIMSLDWDCKSDRLLLIGTNDGGIKAWNVDAKRVVCDLNTTEAFPSVLDLKCSPVEPIFVSAAASRGYGSTSSDKLGFASLTVWNMKTWKAMSVLPLGEDPPAVTSLCFNHNGKILAASATDGMIHMFDMSAGLQITGWPAHDSAISSILFGPDETSIFSLGADGKIIEWSLQNQGQILWSRNCSRFCNPESSKHCRHEMALDANGRRLLVTSGSVRSPIYQVRGYMDGMRTLPHSAAITTVDWHPTLPIFLTGSADNSVRVTSIS
ncbi:uncharacterized protein LOC131145967 isoform X4 [Malania oleifera]|uniref:uncharacterized protein LOC131145967 isoform X4 n=1 Tax=Malania oleifera TaxID=397392 RepID=UPI0025ADE9B9|nr:uncharacterized protein LOC131145967 isoform X4 [Malania oleifera]